MKPDADEQEAIDRLAEWDPWTISGAVKTPDCPTEFGGPKTRSSPGNAELSVGTGGPGSPSCLVQLMPGDADVTRVASYARHAQSIYGYTAQGDRPTYSGSPVRGDPPAGLGKLGRSTEHGLRRNLAARIPEPANQYGGDHYQRLNPEPITIIESWGLGWNLANVVKYVSRAGSKSGNTRASDLYKAAWYLDREIQLARIGEDDIASA